MNFYSFIGIERDDKSGKFERVSKHCVVAESAALALAAFERSAAEHWAGHEVSVEPIELGRNGLSAAQLRDWRDVMCMIEITVVTTGFRGAPRSFTKVYFLKREPFEVERVY